MTLGGRGPMVEDDLRWKTTFDGRQPSVEHILWWKTTFGGKQPWAEDNLWWILACYLVPFAAFFTFTTHAQSHILELLLTTNMCAISKENDLFYVECAVHKENKSRD